MTEPISDEDLEWFRRSLASDRHGIRIEMGTEQLRGVLTRLDAAEAAAVPSGWEVVRVDGIPYLTPDRRGSAMTAHECGMGGLDRDAERVFPANGEAQFPRPFLLVRHEDATGVSTEQGAHPGGTVAWGVEFPDGVAVTRWCVSDIRQTAVFASVDDVKAIHGHDGKTEVVYT